MARRIAFNLSVQNALETHQYVRTLIEFEKGKTLYSYALEDFFTPTEWYDRNKIAQIDIPEPDFSKVEALSFESCHLLEPGIEDEYTIYHLRLRKDLSLLYLCLIGFGIVSIVGLRFALFGIGVVKETIVHIPIAPTELESSGEITDEVIVYLANNYTNPNLTLKVLSKEFGLGEQKISNYIKENTKLSFPRYLNFLRIEEAKRLLKSGKYNSVSEVGYSVGFNSPTNFNRVFKGAVGVAPKAYVEMNK